MTATPDKELYVPTRRLTPKTSCGWLTDRTGHHMPGRLA